MSIQLRLEISLRTFHFFCIFGVHLARTLNDLWKDQRLYKEHLMMFNNLRRNAIGISGEATQVFVQVFGSTLVAYGDEPKAIESASVNTEKVLLTLKQVEDITCKQLISLDEITVSSFLENNRGTKYALIMDKYGETCQLFLWRNHPDLQIGCTYRMDALHASPVTNRVFLAMSETSKVYHW